MVKQSRTEKYAFVHTISLKLENDYTYNQEELERALSILKEQKVDLRYGDLVETDMVKSYRNDGLCIYDGTKLINLEWSRGRDEYGSLPEPFEVLRTNKMLGFFVRSVYWHSNPYRHIEHNGYVNLLLTSDEKKELITNLIYEERQIGDRIEGKNLFSHFHRTKGNKKKRYIIMYRGSSLFDDEDEDQLIGEFKSMIKGNYLLSCGRGQYSDPKISNTVFVLMPRRMRLRG